MSEQTIEERIQTILQGLDQFADTDVVISDFSILDQTLQRAPLAIIEIADDFRASDEFGGCLTVEWFIPVLLIERFVADQETRLQLRDKRQAVIDRFVGDRRNMGSPGVECNVIKNDGPVSGYNPTAKATKPLILYQRLIFEVIEEAS